MVEVLVVGYGLPEIEAKCVSSVVTNTDYPYYLTYYDNFRYNKPLTQIWNVFIKNSTAGCICLLNSDTVVYPNWLSRMMNTFEMDRTIGFVGPSTNNCHSPQKSIATYEESQKYLNQYEIMKDPISGFCLLFWRDVWFNYGGFDEKYYFYGSESDLIDRAQNKGIKCAWRKDAFVYHIGEASVKASGMDVKKEREKSRELYWSTRKK